MHPIFAKIIQAFIYSYCYDTHALQLYKCSETVAKRRVYVPGDIVFTNKYPSPSSNSSWFPVTVKKILYQDNSGHLTESSKYINLPQSSLHIPAHQHYWKLNGDILDAPTTDLIYNGVSPHLCMFATQCSEQMNRFVELESKRFSVAILGMQTQWTGFGRRLLTFKKFLDRLDPNDIVIWSDSSDVRFLPTCSPSDIITTFKTFKTPIVFMGEKHCWPDSSLKEKFPIPESNPKEYRFLNAGLSIGHVWAYRDVLSDLIESGNLKSYSDDQYLFHKVFLANRSFTNTSGVIRSVPEGQVVPEAVPYISIDYHQQLMADMQNEPLSSFDINEFTQSGRVIFKPSGGRPCMFHEMGKKVNESINRIENLFSAINVPV
jgi:hypothetical protein